MHYYAPYGHSALVPVSTGGTTGVLMDAATLREHLRLGTSTEDALLEGKIAAATRRLEGRTERAFLYQQFDFVIDRFPCDNSPIRLPKTPLASVLSVNYYDTTGGLQSFSSSGYFEDTYSEPGRLCLNSGYTWPINTRCHVAGVIRFKAGYSSAAGGIPDPLVEAVKKLATELYENREASSLGNSVNEPLPYGIEELIAPYVFPEFA